MADPSYISQNVVEAAPDAGTASISQEVVEGGADDGSTFVSQTLVESGADDASTYLSQLVVETGADDASAFISQIVIEWSAGDLIPPPPPEPATGTFVFDEGGSVEYWIVPQVSDGGIELVDKDIKAVRIIGKVTNANAKVYVWGPTEPIIVSDLEDGVNSTTGAIPIPDTTDVTQSPRLTANCPNGMLSTVRIAGTWDGVSSRDRIDEILYEWARQGIRR